MDLPFIIKLIALLLFGVACLVYFVRQTRALNRRGEELKRQWAALNIQLDIHLEEEGERMLSESRQLRIVSEEPILAEKLQRMEALSIQLSKLLGFSMFMLGESLGRPEGTWSLEVNWSHLDGHDEVTYVVLQKRVKGWVRSKWQRVMVYHRNYETDIREEKRRMHEFDNSVVAELDTLSDELEQKIVRASQNIEDLREQFRKVVEKHPREKKHRFDQIDPLP